MVISILLFYNETAAFCVGMLHLIKLVSLLILQFKKSNKMRDTESFLNRNNCMILLI